ADDLGVSVLDMGTLDGHTVTIDWGDGSILDLTGTFGSDPFGPPGSVEGNLRPIFGSHVYADDSGDGVYTVTITVTDDEGQSHSDSFDITVLNVAPEVRTPEGGLSG